MLIDDDDGEIYRNCRFGIGMGVMEMNAAAVALLYAVAMALYIASDGFVGVGYA